MSLLQPHQTATDRQLRQFGVISAVALPAIGWLWAAGTSTILILLLFGVALAVSGFVWPRILRPIFITLSLLTAPIGFVVGEVAMLFIFFAVFLPFGLVFRIMGRDVLHKHPDRNTMSYWQKKHMPTSPSSYYRQS